MATDSELEQAKRLGIQPSSGYQQRKQRYEAGQTLANTPTNSLLNYGPASAGRANPGEPLQPSAGYAQRQGAYADRKAGNVQPVTAHAPRMAPPQTARPNLAAPLPAPTTYDERKQRYAAGETPANTVMPSLPAYGAPGNVSYEQRGAEYAERNNPRPAQPLPALPQTEEYTQRLGAYADRQNQRQQAVDALAIPAPGPDATPAERAQHRLATSTAPGAGFARGAAKAFSGAVDTVAGASKGLIATPADALRVGATRLVGGDPNTLEGGPTRHQDEAFGQLDRGINQLGDMVNGLQATGRNLLGVQPASAAQPEQTQPTGPSIPGPADSAGASTPVAATAPVTSDAGPQDTSSGGFQRTSVDGVVGRRGASGVPEFSNMPRDVEGASSQQMTAGRMGNGVGGLSFGAPGDSQLAMDRFQRASEIRAGTRQLQQQMEDRFVPGAGRVTGIRDTSRTPTTAELLNDRRTAADHRRTDAAADRSLRERELEANLGIRNRELNNTEQTGDLERQRLGMEIATGNMGLEQQRRIEQIRHQLSDSNLDPAARQQLERTYNTLTTPAKDRYVLQDAVMGQDAMGSPVFGKVALDVTTGKPVGQADQPSRRSAVSRAEVEQTARNRGMTPNELIEQLKARGVSVNG